MQEQTGRRTPPMPRGRVRSAVEALGPAIVAGEFPPLATLPNEEALSLRFGVSRPSLREAIKVLTGKGLVRTVRRYGSRVRAKAEWNHLDPDVLSWHLRDPANLPQFLRDIREMRLLLEPVASAMAARRATPAEVAQLLAIAKRLPEVPVVGSIDTDVAFHVTVLRASGNLLIAGLAPAMDVLMHAYLHAMQRVERGPPIEEGAMRLHLRTAEAIAAGDAVLARRYAEQMLDITSGVIDRVLRELAADGVPDRSMERASLSALADLRDLSPL
jgi:DNA-binding FadR family transcriptional regulator